MRLINTHTLDIEEFEGQKVPPYAILSHRWEDQEVLFQDIERRTHLTKEGWEKIKKFCELARKDGLSYAWVDTCCIDKRNSADLSEAINSMFRWYQQSDRCYVYLCDVRTANTVWEEWEELNIGVDRWANLTYQDEESLSPHKLPILSGHFVSEFCSSVWFTRGWTLQELLASQRMKFFGCYWQMLGTKDFLCAPISHRTGIATNILIHKKALNTLTIAERMSWAAKRETTRIEDRAYGLMGIFEVNMPMLYGEGEGAFMRLQEEILKRSNDQSILLWDSDELGLLASSPDAFATHVWTPPDTSKRSFYPFNQTGFVDEIISYTPHEVDAASTLTNTGLSINLTLLPWYLDVYLAPLEVTRTTRSGNSFSHKIPHIFLKQQVSGVRLSRVKFRGEAFIYLSEDDNYNLIDCSKFAKWSDDDDDSLEKRSKVQCLIARGDLMRDNMSRTLDSNPYGIQFEFKPNDCWGPGRTPRAEDVITRHIWSPTDERILFEVGVWGVLAVLRVYHPIGDPSYMYFGFDRGFTPCCVQKMAWDHEATFDKTVEAGPGSNLSSNVLDPWEFNEAVVRGTNEGQLVIRGSRNPYVYTLYNTTIPDIRIMMSRGVDGYGYLFELGKGGFRGNARWEGSMKS